MKRSPLVLAAVLSFAAPLVVVEAKAGWSPSDTAAADASLSQIVSTQTPSVAACVAMDGVPVYQKAFGTVAPGGAAATPKTIYRIGSVSKQFTAAAILKLIEGGAKIPSDGSAFGLETNVGAFFPAAVQWTPANGPPETIRRLLTMTSNLPNYTDSPPPGLEPTKPVKTDALLNGILAFKPTSPTPAYAYSNTNYFLLASVIEGLINPLSKKGRGGGPPAFSIPQTYEDYLRKHVFAPADLQWTNFIDDPNPLAPMAPPTVGPGAPFANPNWPRGAGAIQSNVIDLCAWDKALMQNKVLTPASVATMGTEGLPGDGYAMAWAVAKFPTDLEYSHSGEIPGYTAFNLIKLYNGTHFVSVSILTNGDHVGGLDQIARSLGWSAMAKPPCKTACRNGFECVVNTGGPQGDVASCQKKPLPGHPRQ